MQRLLNSESVWTGVRGPEATGTQDERTTTLEEVPDDFSRGQPHRDPEVRRRVSSPEVPRRSRGRSDEDSRNGRGPTQGEEEGGDS